MEAPLCGWACEPVEWFFCQTTFHILGKESSSLPSARCCSALPSLSSSHRPCHRWHKWSLWYRREFFVAALVVVFFSPPPVSASPSQSECRRLFCVSACVFSGALLGQNLHHNVHTYSIKLVLITIAISNSQRCPSHLKGFSPVWILMCLSSNCCLTKAWPQNSQWKGFSWPWALTPCTVNLSIVENLSKHVWQLIKKITER